MRRLDPLYKTSLMLLTDLYQLTMAYGYWRLGRHEDEAVFHLSFRNNPFHGGFAVACGLSDVIELLRRFRFDDDDLQYLASLQGEDGRRLFDDHAFLDALRAMTFSCDVDAIPEGTVVFAGEPMVRVRGPMWQRQLLETPLLTLVNFPTLIATKAARISLAAGDQPVLEFGLRRAQGIDGGSFWTLISGIMRLRCKWIGMWRCDGSGRSPAIVKTSLTGLIFLGTSLGGSEESWHDCRRRRVCEVGASAEAL